MERPEHADAVRHGCVPHQDQVQGGRGRRPRLFFLFFSAAPQGPAPTNVPADKPDVIDEALRFFKANVLFRNFELNGSADKVRTFPPPLCFLC